MQPLCSPIKDVIFALSAEPGGDGIVMEMHKTLEKTRRKTPKKRHGAVEVLHEGSRHSGRPHGARFRDQR